MLYNDLITYNQTNITYTGTIQINVPGLSNPIILGNVTVVISAEADYSNATTIGIVSYDFAPSGIVTIQSGQEQSEALVSADIAYIDSTTERNSHNRGYARASRSSNRCRFHIY